MTRHEQAEKLRAFADEWGSGSHQCLTLSDLGAIFGNDFWLLVTMEHREMVIAVRDMAVSTRELVDWLKSPRLLHSAE